MAKTRVCSFICFLLLLAALAPAGELKTENVIIVMTDGLRCMEVFSGAEDSVAVENKASTETIQKLYRQPTPEARREALLPFIWTKVAREGQIYGNRDKGSSAQVTNGLKFSYPGFSETLTGLADPAINTNDAVYNPNENVLEWLNKQKPCQGRTAAFGAWDRFEHILNAPRCGFPVNSGFQPLTVGKRNAQIDLLNRLKEEIPSRWGTTEPFDALTYHTALEYLKENKPRLLFLCYGETDEWGHEGDYWEYLNAAHRFDAGVRELWETVQSMRQYKDKTTLILLTDHGRGDGPAWRNHGQDVANAEYIWFAVMGPDTPALGERSNVAPIGQNQVAATIAALFGKDYKAAHPKAGAPIADVVGPNRKQHP